MSIFGDFCRMVACCYAAGQREEEYLEIAKRYTRDELNQFAQAMALLVNEMQEKPFEDCLGPYYTDIAAKSTVSARGEFYTPQALAEVMAHLTVDPAEVIEKGRPITVSDPCSGSGGLILSFAKLFAPQAPDQPSHVDLIRSTLVDVNPIAADMAYINTTLWGIPAQVIWGNTLSLETHSGWRNIHWARVGEDQRRQTEQMVTSMDEVLSATSKAEERSKASQPSVTFETGEQLDLF